LFKTKGVVDGQQQESEPNLVRILVVGHRLLLWS
jgi:hypothetical protein